MEGQVKHTSVTVIGGANMDICGSPAKPLVAKDSNPGHVTVRPGGVGRNIAHNLRLLGMPVSLITALGDDAYGAALKENCRSLGINLRMSLMLPGSRSSTYLYLTDEKGEMQWAINDMEIMRHLTPGVLAPHMEQINASPLVLVDGGDPRLPGRALPGTPLRRPGVRGQGPADAGPAGPHPGDQAQPAGGGGPHRRG